jgi:5-amino-6-(5-phosphoribosylamino)uracil reductase
MRQLLPHPVDDIDCYEAYRPSIPGPHVRLNMIMSGDGAVTDPDGHSGGLAGPGDREVFRVLRAHADAILVGAGTARHEGYGPHRVRRDLAERRAADGRADPAAIVLVSRSLRLDFGSPLFTEAVTPTVVLTSAAADPALRAEAERAGGVVVAGDVEVDLRAGLDALRERFGYPHVLCEGGPSLNGALLSAGLVDELCLTLAPLLAGGHGPRLAPGLPAPRGLELTAALEDAGELFLRYSLTRPLALPPADS